MISKKAAIESFFPLEKLTLITRTQQTNWADFANLWTHMQRLLYMSLYNYHKEKKNVEKSGYPSDNETPQASSNC